MSAIGLVGGVITMIMRLTGSDIPAGWTTLVVMVAILSGMQLMSLGLIGLYIGVVFDEAKRRPQILVAQMITSAPVSQEEASGRGNPGRRELGPNPGGAPDEGVPL